MQQPDTRGNANSLLDSISIATGKVTSWLTLLMVLVTTVVVIMRYVFDAGLIWLQESVTWMHAVVFMLGASYTLQQEEHVRVDVFYRGTTERRQAWVDLAGVLLFLMPMCAFLAYKSFDFVAASWSMREASRESGGLPYPLIPLLKTALVVMPLALFLQGLSLMLRALAVIRER